MLDKNNPIKQDLKHIKPNSTKQVLKSDKKKNPMK